MSDSEGDIDDELLALAGGESERKRKRSQPNSSSKRRKAEAEDDSDSDGEQPESEEEQTQRNPYPLEGKYIDEEDRARLMEMSEIDRENILAQRQEEMQRYTDRRQLENMLKMQGGRGSADESVSNAAKRQHAVRGATKEKSRKLDELKAKRKAKSEKKRTRANSPKRDRSSSPMDMETSEDEEDGQITKYDEEEERDRKLYGTSHPDDEPITLEDLSKCRVTRDQIAKYCMAPWFEDFIKGAWVRFLIGQENGQPVYRICEVVDIVPTLVKPYLVNDQMVNQELDLKHGSSTRNFGMDRVSNAPFDQKEFDRLVKSCEADKVKLPTKRQVEKKAAQLHKYATQPMTESDVAAMLARKQAINASKQSPAALALERSRLHQARTLAVRRQDYAEVADIDARLAQLTALAPPRETQREEGSSDILAKLNERNRKANQEAVRKAERAELERKRRERSLRAGTATPTGNLSDAASRLRAKMLGNVGASRPATPGTPTQPADGGAATSRSVSPSANEQASKTSNSGKSFEASILQSVEIDLGDF
ncbi:plus-3-domain-containing protein [Trametes coccinea BRFM310]|uniref:Plus-3-domain-containing protein n=1 Tax=Trametes coccinea (strain BRFM310) TaxID=1353009 RepID=A0A1Y2IH32_TRAC3|nr:plus-3-domain-containing protein [Trametes coccinea BRFM310]